MLSTTTPRIDTVDLLAAAASKFMHIADTTLGSEKNFAVRFRGRLTQESTQAYRQAAESFRPLGFTPLFRKEDDAHVVLAVPGAERPQPSNPWVNVILFALTVASVLLTGAFYGYTGVDPATPLDWARFLISGWPFLASMLGILVAHELGHYFAARYHKVAVTLPYFLPFPLSPFGTLGAFIRLKSPPTNRRVLLDIGMAGPLAGLVIAVPVLILGLATSTVSEIPEVMPAGQFLQLEGNSILYAGLKRLILGEWLPRPASFGDASPLVYMLRFYILGRPLPFGGTDVLLNSIAWAGWAGLLVTGLNLIPAGQLDGGHALYVLIGERTRRVLPFVIVALVGLGFLWPGWFLYAALIYFMGRYHAEPLDQITELDAKRKVLALAVLVIFVLIFTPVPLSIGGA